MLGGEGGRVVFSILNVHVCTGTAHVRKREDRSREEREVKELLSQCTQLIDG